ncbi:MAG: LapA family protein [Synergistaceae bacterium]|jgi:uncharacterized integral membrane protein|nr:LapA family protein [Synergistaceae bacterium]
MKVHILAIAVSILLTAIYSIQNSQEITVRFFSTWTFRQGVWEAILFAGGVLIMWISSMFGSWDTYVRNKKVVKEKDKRIAELEEERKSLISAIRMTPNEAADRQLAAEPPETADETVYQPVEESFDSLSKEKETEQY